MADNPYVPIQSNVTTGANAASYINTVGNSTEVAIKVVSTLAEAGNESGYYITDSIVFVLDELKFYTYSGTAWVETDAIAVKGEITTLTNSIGNHILDLDNPHQVTPTQVGSPSLVGTSVVDNLVSFSNVTGSQKDSGYKSTDFVAKSGSTMTGDLTVPYLISTTGIKIGNLSDAASASNVGTLRYRVSGNNSYCEMCMQTSGSTYVWVTIIQNNW